MKKLSISQKSQYTSELVNLFRIMCSDVSPKKPSSILNKLKQDFYEKFADNPHDQNDARQFFLFLLNQMHKELKNDKIENMIALNLKKSFNIDLKKRIPSIVNDLFMGVEINTIKCCFCNEILVSSNEWITLNLPITKTRNTNFVIKLYFGSRDCLKSGILHSFTFEFNKSSQFKEICLGLSQITNINTSKMIICGQRERKIQKLFDYYDSVFEAYLNGFKIFM